MNAIVSIYAFLFICFYHTMLHRYIVFQKVVLGILHADEAKEIAECGVIGGVVMAKLGFIHDGLIEFFRDVTLQIVYNEIVELKALRID